MYDSEVKISNCYIKYNTLLGNTSGGAIYIKYNTTVAINSETNQFTNQIEISDSYIINNKGFIGGGLYIENGNVLFSEMLFNNNSNSAQKTLPSSNDNNNNNSPGSGPGGNGVQSDSGGSVRLTQQQQQSQQGLFSDISQNGIINLIACNVKFQKSIKLQFMNHKSSVIYCENSYISMTGMYFDSNTCGHGCAIFSKTCQIIITMF